jgi:hypothetical protein
LPFTAFAALLLAAAAPHEEPRGERPELTAVLAVGDAPQGPGTELAELSHQLRAACRDRVSGVAEVPQMRARLLGDGAAATLPELERAYVGAQAAFQADELDSALRTLRAIVADLDRLPESRAAWSLWVRAHLRIALAERASRRPAEAAAAVERILALEPDVAVDPQQYPPSFRREVDEVRRRAAQLPRRKLVITSGGRAATAFVEGKEVGRTPLTVALPPGRYRVGAAAGRLRAPAVHVEVAGDDVRVELDLALAEAVRPDAGPGLALPPAPAERAAALVRAGAWLGVDRVVAASTLSEGEARFLSGAVLDVRRGALLREGRVRMAGGAVPSASLGALASFLLTGQPALGVTPVAPAPAPLAGSGAGAASAEVSRRAGVAPPGWLRPAAWASGAVALGLAGLGTQQALAARDGYRSAGGLLRSDGALQPGVDRSRYDTAVGRADASRRNAYLAAGGTLAFAALAGVLGYLSVDDGGGPAVRF